MFICLYVYMCFYYKKTVYLTNIIILCNIQIIWLFKNKHIISKMEIVDVPKKFQPAYTFKYPSHTSGKNIEEVMYSYLCKEKDNIKTDYVYLPVFWTSFYIERGWAKNINDLYDWLETLDKTKKYFTIILYSRGVLLRKMDGLNITVFSSGGAGVNITSKTIKIIKNREIFYGNAGDYIIPLICNPPFPDKNIEKTIYCSFMGRYDTHQCRQHMLDTLKHNKSYQFSQSVGYSEYVNIINKSIFTLAPRGYGYTSYRLFEAVLAGSIPIYIWEDKKVLPFSDLIDWEEYAVIIESKDIQNLHSILNTIDINKMQQKIENIKHMFTFEYTIKYIVKKLKIC
jgi:hypothetical protein